MITINNIFSILQIQYALYLFFCFDIIILGDVMYNNENTNFIYDNIKQNIYKNTLWIVLIIIVVILSIIFFSMKSSNNSYIILDNNKIIEYNNEKYQYVDNDDYIKSNW